MAPLPSASASLTPTSCVPPASGVKRNANAGEQSYFTTPSSSTIRVTTPLDRVPSSASISPVHAQQQQQQQQQQHREVEGSNSIPSSDPEMLQRLAAFLPAPPTLSLPSSRRNMEGEQSSPSSSPSSPQISTFHRASNTGQRDLPSPMDRSRRTPPPDSFPTMNVSTSPNQHVLRVQLPTSIQPEMITVSANRGDRLKVVADAWHMEADCHYEWQISFAPHDIDMTAIHAKYEANGLLNIGIRRLPRHNISQH